MNHTEGTLATSLGTSIPRHHLIAAFNDSAQATVALRALHEAGFAESATAFCAGPDFLTSWKDAAGQPGIFARLAALFPSEENEALADYLAEVSHGASLISVHLSGHEEIARARDILKPLGAFDTRYFGNLTIIDL
ncbi:MAG: hypothetical protein M3Z20_01510 [Chloroflexota bacterium]|nr:hypothetical protein [Chloroflexota bacterium]